MKLHLYIRLFYIYCVLHFFPFGTISKWPQRQEHIDLFCVNILCVLRFRFACKKCYKKCHKTNAKKRATELPKCVAVCAPHSVHIHY